MKPQENMLYAIEIIQTKDRWISDNVLQKKAWDRVTSGDAYESYTSGDIGERAHALAVTGGMWLKRKLGWGLDIEPGLKF